MRNEYKHPRESWQRKFDKHANIVKNVLAIAGLLVVGYAVIVMLFVI